MLTSVKRMDEMQEGRWDQRSERGKKTGLGVSSVWLSQKDPLGKKALERENGGDGHRRGCITSDGKKARTRKGTGPAEMMWLVVRLPAQSIHPSCHNRRIPPRGVVTSPQYAKSPISLCTGQAIFSEESR